MELKDQSRRFLRELRCYQFWKEVRCELLGTFVYVILGCGTMTNVGQDTEQKLQESSKAIPTQTYTSLYDEEYNASAIVPSSSYVNVALAFGLAAATVIQCVGHVSGGHINPAVSLAMLVMRRVSLARCLAYITAQTLESVLASCILYGISSHITERYFLGAIRPSDYTSLPQAFAVELIITFVVVLAYCANFERYRLDVGSTALSIGLSISAVHLFAVSL